MVEVKLVSGECDVFVKFSKKAGKACRRRFRPPEELDYSLDNLSSSSFPRPALTLDVDF